MNDAFEEVLGRRPHRALISVPEDGADELEAAGIANLAPTFRGSLGDVVLAIGVDAAALVTLLQTPETIRQLAQWLVGRVHQRANSITIVGRRENRTLRLTVTGDVSVEVVARFIQDALSEES